MAGAAMVPLLTPRQAAISPPSQGDGTSGQGDGGTGDQGGDDVQQLPPPYTQEERAAMISLGWTPGTPHEDFLDRVRAGNGDVQPRGASQDQDGGMAMAASGDKSGSSGGSAAPRHEATHPEPSNPPYAIGDVVDPPGGGRLYEVVIDSVTWDAANNEWDVSGINRRVDGNPGGGTRVTWQIPGPIHTTPTNGNGGTPTYTDYTVAPAGFTQDEWDRLPLASQRQYYLSGGDDFWTDVLRDQVDHESRVREEHELLREADEAIAAARASGDADALEEAFLAYTRRAVESADEAALAWLADQEEAASINVRYEDEDGATVAASLRGYILDYAVDRAARRNLTTATLQDIQNIAAVPEPGDVAALQAIADDPEKADLTIIVPGPDGEPVQTTVGEYLNNTLIPNHQQRIYDPDGPITEANAASAWNQDQPDIDAALATLNDPDATPEELRAAAETLQGLAGKYGEDVSLAFSTGVADDPETAADESKEVKSVRQVLNDWAAHAAGRADSIYTAGEATQTNVGAAWQQDQPAMDDALAVLNDPDATPEQLREAAATLDALAAKYGDDLTLNFYTGAEDDPETPDVDGVPWRHSPRWQSSAHGAPSPPAAPTASTPARDPSPRRTTPPPGTPTWRPSTPPWPPSMIPTPARRTWPPPGTPWTT